ncbi:MAG TPA: hypothetical protein VF960_09890 [Chloroflexota bacterium]
MALTLEDGSRVAVIGGGPAGSFFSYFLLDMLDRTGTEIELDIYEPRDYSIPGPIGCNMCGGIISESLVQNLATEGINLPSNVVQRGIDSYVMHTDLGAVHLKTPLDEKRIAAVHRGSGPRTVKEVKWKSFDGYLQSLAVQRGANIIKGRVDEVTRAEGKFAVKAKGGEARTYDLIAVSVGVNTAALKLFEGLGTGYKAPATTQTAIREYYLGEELIAQYLGSSMHVFLLDIPRLEFAAIIPKGDYVTLAMLGQDIDGDLLKSFLTAPEVRECFPPDWQWDQQACNCSPRMSLQAATHPYGDGILFLGDCGVTRLYKDGIGAAYRGAKAAASAVVFHGASEEALRRHYWPALVKMDRDNLIGRFIFLVTHLIQKSKLLRKGVVRMTASEQKPEVTWRPMSMVLWDMFTGSAPYRDILIRTLHPIFIIRLVLSVAVSILPGSPIRK